MKTTAQLKPIHSERTSFYGKAQVHHDGTKHTLQSYNILILTYDEASDAITFLTSNKNHFTATTNRHINEILQQFTNAGKKTKSQLLKMANII